MEKIKQFETLLDLISDCVVQNLLNKEEYDVVYLENLLNDVQYLNQLFVTNQVAEKIFVVTEMLKQLIKQKKQFKEKRA